MLRVKMWVPNLFTLGNLSLGFFSILLSMGYRAEQTDRTDLLTLAGGLILLAALMDGLDGFAARLLNAQSELGAQLDSLADMTTFGIAPGVLMYSLALKSWTLTLGPGTSLPIGMFVGAIFPMCAAYRLARFNVKHDTGSFQGLPSPVAGIIVGLMPLAFPGNLDIAKYLMVAVFVLAAFLMVSTARYLKPQVAGFRRFTPFRLGLLLGVVALVLIFVAFFKGPTYSAAGIFFIIVAYTMTGVVSLIIQLIHKFRV